VSEKLKQAQARKKRVEKEVLPTAGKESTGVISKAMPSPAKGGQRFYSGRLCVFITKAF
jgi:hypothetical protein